MSVRAAELVWAHFPDGGNRKLIMLALADYANDDGQKIHPSIATLAAKVCCSEAQARRTLHALIDAGYVHVVGNERGGAPGATRHYRLDLERLRAGLGARPTGSTDATPTPCSDATRTPGADASPLLETACMDARDGLHTCAPTGSTDATQTNYRTVKNQEEHARTPARVLAKRPKREEITFADFCRTCQQGGVLPIPEDDPVFRYAEKVGIPAPFLELAWRTFEDRYRVSRKRYRDWRGVFRNAVERNWYRLWWIDGAGTYKLTTAGAQAHLSERAAA